MDSHSTPAITGNWIHIFDPNESRFPDRQARSTRGKWYTKDHAIVRGPDGSWHGYGIIGYKRAGLPWPWKIEKQLFHITSPQLAAGCWQEHPYALHADPGAGERFTWAPHAIVNGKEWVMFYAVGNLRPLSYLLPSVGNIHVAFSTNGFDWTRYPENPVVMDWGYARDPMVLFHDGTYYLYYTTSRGDNDFHSSVAVRKSKDLRAWSGRKIVHVQPHAKGWFAGNAESPFVVHKDGLFYLFVCVALDGYNLTRVYWSRSPEAFPVSQHACDLQSHASEVIVDEHGSWFITNTGWDKKGLFIAPLRWM